MNVLIYGDLSTGKSKTAQALRLYHESKLESCFVIEEEELNPQTLKTLISGEDILNQIVKAQNNKVKHFIFVTPLKPSNAFFHLSQAFNKPLLSYIDYSMHCRKLSV